MSQSTESQSGGPIESEAIVVVEDVLNAKG